MLECGLDYLEGERRSESMTRWISATVNEEYSSEELEGIEGLQEGDNVILEADGRWHKA